MHIHVVPVVSILERFPTYFPYLKFAHNNNMLLKNVYDHVGNNDNIIMVEENLMVIRMIMFL